MYLCDTLYKQLAIIMLVCRRQAARRSLPRTYWHLPTRYDGTWSQYVMYRLLD